MATLNGTPLQRARVTMPRHGVWEGTCATAGVLDLAPGDPATLTIGDLTLAGHVVAGGTFAGASESTYTLAGGAAGWTRSIPAKGFFVPGGVKLVDVVLALAADAGERFDTSAISPLTILGDHWQRPAGPASAALSALFPLASGGWRVDPDGTTRVGPRAPVPLPVGLEYAVEDAPRDRRWARIGIANDQVSAFLPGAVVTAPNMSAPLVVGELTIHASPERIVVEALGESGIVEMLAALVLALSPAPSLLGAYRYQVSSDPGAPQLKALSPGVPDVISCSKLYGIPGVSATLTPGSVVLVEFADGNPARPLIATYDSTPPSNILIDAVTNIIAGAGGVSLGKAAPIIAWATGVNDALASAGHPAALLADPSTTKLLGS